MKPSKLQDLTRKTNWALFQIKGAKGNLVSAARAVGLTTYALQNELDRLEKDIKFHYEMRKKELISESIKTKVIANELSARND